MHRREFLAISSLGAFAKAASSVAEGRCCHALDEGARPDGRTLNTAALQKAIDRTHEAGGGTVYLPAGIFLTGGLVLRSRVRLHLEAGAVLRGSTDLKDYPYHPGPPEEGDANGRHLIFARREDDIAITGFGIIDGQGHAFWRKRGRPAPRPEDLWADVIAWDYEAATQRRPAPMLEFAECRNVHVEGVTLTNAPSWTMRPVACESVFIRGVRVRNPIFAPNTDGMDITASRNVFVSDCDIETGDDAICIKSENPYGELLPTKNITVTNCILSTCCNGFKVGTATYGSVDNIVFSNSIISSDNSAALNERATSGIALEVVDGGSLDAVRISNIRMQNARTPIFVRLGRRNPRAGTFLRNVALSGIDATGALVTSSITGIPGLHVSEVTLNDIRIQSDEQGRAEWVARPIPEQRQSYPEARMFGRLPAAGLYIRHASRIRLSNVAIQAAEQDERPKLLCEDVEDLDLSGLTSRPPAGDEPLIVLRNTHDAFLHNLKAPLNAQSYMRIEGASTRISLAANDLSGARTPVVFAADPASGTIVSSGTASVDQRRDSMDGNQGKRGATPESGS